jgi:methyltransferase
MVGAYLALLGAVALQRLSELVLSRRHAALAFARGGIERGRSQLLPMKLLHGAFLVSCALEVIWLRRPLQPALALCMLAVLVAAQALRLWTQVTLGPSWNTRVIVVPGAPRVRHGPYRWMRHPNYLAVAAELIALPLVYGAWLTALVFSLANAPLLYARIRCEDETLAVWCAAPEGS